MRPIMMPATPADHKSGRRARRGERAIPAESFAMEWLGELDLERPPQAADSSALRLAVIRRVRYAVSHATDGASLSFAAAMDAISGSATPFLTAVTSASIEIAISGGVRLPM